MIFFAFWILLPTVLTTTLLSVEHEEFFVATIQKSGTHLLIKTLKQLLEKDEYHPKSNSAKQPSNLADHLNIAKQTNRFLRLHLAPKKKNLEVILNSNHKVLFLYRDPRDQLISLLMAILKRDCNCWPLDLRNPVFQQMSFDEQLLELITGEKLGYSVPEKMFIPKLQWLDLPQHLVLSLKFEDLVGTEGGGTRETQLTAIQSIAKHLNVDLDIEEIMERSQNLFGKPGDPKFCTGKIGKWKQYFKKEHQSIFHKLFGKMTERLGYDSTRSINRRKSIEDNSQKKYIQINCLDTRVYVLQRNS